jgi:PST family polysaccharide transporter
MKQLKLADKSPEKSPSQDVDIADLKRKSVRGGTVTMVSQAISIAIQLTSTVILARLLSPDDYGIIAMVMAITAFAGVFRDLGLSSAAVQKKDLTRAQQSNLFWLNVAMGAVLTAIVAVASPLVAWFYGQPELTLVTVALSFTFLIGSLGTQHGARLVREMQFGRMAVATIAGSIAGLITSVTLALQSFAYWALVWGVLSGAVTTTVLLFILSPFRPALFSRNAGIREMVGFGANVTAFDLVNYFHRNLDNVLIGKFWGADALGLYSRAYQLLMFPITAIRGPINAVAFPAMSRLQRQPEDYRHYYRKITHLLALVSMPLTAFLFVSAGPVIELLLGKNWAGVSPIFAILALSGFIQPVAGLRGVVLLSCGHGKRMLAWGIINAVCVCGGFLIGVRWGVFGVATSYAIVNYLLLYPSLLLVFKNTPLHVSDFFQPIIPPVIAALSSSALALLCQRWFGLGSMPPIFQICILTVVFVITFLSLWALFPGGMSSPFKLVDQIKRLLRAEKQLDNAD